MQREVQYWIDELNLTAHPEGGYYRETYRSSERMPEGVPSGRVGGERSCSTAIYYLLPAEEVSRLHRLLSDELLHFYAGSAFSIHLFPPGGGYQRIELGADRDRGAVFQAVVSAGCWFGATVEPPGTFALVGCTVAPGFEFDDFEAADRAALVAEYPQHRALIERLTPAR